MSYESRKVIENMQLDYEECTTCDGEAFYTCRICRKQYCADCIDDDVCHACLIHDEVFR